MKVLYVVAEAYPLVKTGGLGDVAGALPRALANLGVDVRVMMPGYSAALTALSNIRDVRAFGGVLTGYNARLLESTMPESHVPLWLVDCPPLYARDEHIYQTGAGVDFPDNHLRFGLLSRLAAHVATTGAMHDWCPDVVHSNDWHTGLVSYYLKNQSGPVPASVFTIHNMVYQGLFDQSVLSDLAIVPESFSPSELEFWGKLSFLKAGLVFADRVNTVSLTYAQEVRREPMGMGLDGVIRSRSEKFSGIVNGIDESVWDPARDPFITKNYSATSLTEKAENRTALSAMGLRVMPGRPIIAVVSRLVEQKGVDVLLDALPALVDAGVQFAILGSGDAELEARVLNAVKSFPGNVVAHIGYHEALSHQIIAGSDMILVPSRFEPCGLTQLYGQKYGTLPVVHHIGGLADTVNDGHDGFSFMDLTVEGLASGVIAAASVFHQPAPWARMQKRAMAKKLGWDTCADQYLNLYADLINNKADRSHGADYRAA